MPKDDLTDEIKEYHENNATSGGGFNKTETVILTVFILFFVIAGLGFGIYAAVAQPSVQFVFYAGLSMALLLGLCLLIGPPVFRKQKLQRCTEPVTVRCIRLNERLSESGGGDEIRHRYITYAPVWEYEYLGIKYTYAEAVYSNTNVPQPGSEAQGFIDPQRPSELYRPNKTAKFILALLGGIITAVGAVGLVFVTALFMLIEMS